MPPQQQTDAFLSQANPTSGTKYTVLDTTLNARITSIRCKVTWTVQPTPLEIHVTIDGKAERFFVTDPVSAQFYIASVAPDGSETNQSLIITFTTSGITSPFLIPIYLEGRSIKIEAETTGGTVSNLSVRVKYAKW